MRPLIGLTMWVAPHDDDRTYPTPYTFEFLHRAYAYMIRKAGGVPILLPNPSDSTEVSCLLGVLDGLLLTGGEDLEPHCYDEAVQTDTLELAPDRDTFELMAVRKADELGLPILAICRGIQTLNVAHGGTLWQDLLEQRPKPTDNHSRGGLFYRRFHMVDILPGSRLYDIVGRDAIKVSTAHHQAINTLGNNLKITARSTEDNVVEAVEFPGERFVLGMQWHPEIDENDEATCKIASAFVDACKK